MTKQEFQIILPCYFWQKVINDNGEVGTIDEINRKDNGELLVICYDTVQGCYNQGEFKLILRTMDDMTHDEWSALSTIMSNGSTSDWRYSASFRSGFKFDNQKISLKSFNDITGPINYLRSIGIDCDGLIEAGYAVREKDLKK